MSRVECHILVRSGREVAISLFRNVETFPTSLGTLEPVALLSRSEDKNTVTTEWALPIPKPRRTVRWTQEEVWDPAQTTCRFRQISGDFDELSGTWSFAEVELGLTRFDLVLDYRLEIPLVGAFFRGGIQQAMEEAMSGFQRAIKAYCEGR